jgi:hypothetical protein
MSWRAIASTSISELRVEAVRLSPALGNLSPISIQHRSTRKMEVFPTYCATTACCPQWMMLMSNQQGLILLRQGHRQSQLPSFFDNFMRLTAHLPSDHATAAASAAKASVPTT